MSAMNLFVSWRRAKGLNANPKFPELDLQLGNYLNFYIKGTNLCTLELIVLQGSKKINPDASAKSTPPAVG